MNKQTNYEFKKFIVSPEIRLYHPSPPPPPSLRGLRFYPYSTTHRNLYPVTFPMLRFQCFISRAQSNPLHFLFLRDLAKRSSSAPPPSLFPLFRFMQIPPGSPSPPLFILSPLPPPPLPVIPHACSFRYNSSLLLLLLLRLPSPPPSHLYEDCPPPLHDAVRAFNPSLARSCVSLSLSLPHSNTRGVVQHEVGSLSSSH